MTIGVAMRATPEQIDLWRNLPSEHQRLEFKEAKNQYDYGKLCELLRSSGQRGRRVTYFPVTPTNHPGRWHEEREGAAHTGLVDREGEKL